MAEVGYNPHFEPFFKNEDRYAVLWGGAGSSKSYSAAQKIVERCTHNNEKHKFLVLRKFKTTIEGSVFTLLKEVINSFGIEQHVNVNNTKMDFRFWNGNEIVTSGLDDVDKLKSIHGVTSVWMEEADGFDRYDLGQVNLRLRGETDSYKQIILTFNPISESHWLKKRFFDEGGHNVFTLWSNYKHNKFLDDEYIRLLEEEYSYDDNLYRIYVKGEWGRVVTNEEFYAKFSKKRHVRPVSFNPELPIHLSFDFNVNPYLPLSLWQIEGYNESYRVGCFKLYTMYNPDNNTEAACRAFMEDFPDSDMGIYIYGDASGRVKSTTSTVHNYDIIEGMLKAYLRNDSFRVPRKNPLQDKRRNFLNKCLAGGYEDIIIEIDPTCELMVDDFENVWTESSPSGAKKHKPKAKNKAGVPYEPYGHFSDTFDYLMCGAFEDKFRDFGRKD